MILFDADVSIEILRERPHAATWFDSLNDEDLLAMPGYVAMERAAGCASQRELRDHQNWIARFRILWLPISVAQQALAACYGVALRNAIGVNDMLVSFTALHHGVPLSTFNVKHYRAIAGLRTIQPFRR